MRNSSYVLLLSAFTNCAWCQVDQTYLDTINVPNIFTANNEYKYIFPAKQAFYGAVSNVTCSTDNQYIAFVGDPQGNRQIPFSFQRNGSGLNQTIQPSIYIYNLSNGRSTPVHTFTHLNSRIETVEWVPGTNYVAIVETSNEQSHLIIVDSHTNQKRLFKLGNHQNYFKSPAYHSQSRSFVMLSTRVVQNQQVDELLVLNSTTQQTKVIPIRDTVPMRLVGDGKRIFSYSYDQNLGAPVLSHELDINSGTFVDIENIEYTEPEPKYYVSYRGPVISAQESWRLNESSRVRPRTALLSYDGSEGGCTYDGKQIWFVDRSGLNISDVTTLTAEQFEDMVKEVVKADTIQRAKQVGTAMMIYCADYDDLFPPTSNWQDNVNPYIKNKEMFDGFTYMMNGENGSDIENPASTVMGMIETPFGTAIVYCDSHVVWKDRPKPTYASLLRSD